MVAILAMPVFRCRRPVGRSVPSGTSASAAGPL